MKIVIVNGHGVVIQGKPFSEQRCKLTNNCRFGSVISACIHILLLIYSK